MSELILKYNLLNSVAQQEVRDFIDFLLYKKEATHTASMEAYKKKILNVSVWTAEDEAFMEENTKKMNQWRIEEW